MQMRESGSDGPPIFQEPLPSQSAPTLSYIVRTMVLYYSARGTYTHSPGFVAMETGGGEGRETPPRSFGQRQRKEKKGP